jgi:hyperosmotically inducible protein
MKYPTIISTCILAIAFAATVPACAPKPTQRGTGEAIDDASITARVKTAIAKTEGIGDALAINVDTYRGVVSLSGFVDSEKQAQLAVDAAKKVSGVRTVKNNLLIKPRK